MIGNILGNLLNYGLPGAALGISLIVGVYARKNENKIHELKGHDKEVDVKLEEIKQKLDLVVNYFTEKGMGKK